MYVADLQTELMRRLRGACRSTAPLFSSESLICFAFFFQKDKTFPSERAWHPSFISPFLRSFERRVSRRCSKLIFMLFQEREEKPENNFP
ncbi:hypothetical protein HGG72_23860 [Ochrobactrum pecoris]|nr:hypothetical protein [Brucella pecoris]